MNIYETLLKAKSLAANKPPDDTVLDLRYTLLATRIIR